MISGSSAILVVFLILTLSVFLALRIFDAARVIHMNQEGALLLAHFCLLLTSDLGRKIELNEITEITIMVTAVRVTIS